MDFIKPYRRVSDQDIESQIGFSISEGFEKCAKTEDLQVDEFDTPLWQASVASNFLMSVLKERYWIPGYDVMLLGEYSEFIFRRVEFVARQLDPLYLPGNLRVSGEMLSFKLRWGKKYPHLLFGSLGHGFLNNALNRAVGFNSKVVLLETKDSPKRNEDKYFQIQEFLQIEESDIFSEYLDPQMPSSIYGQGFVPEYKLPQWCRWKIMDDGLAVIDLSSPKFFHKLDCNASLGPNGGIVIE